MSLYAALFAGVSGLNAYSGAMGVISDNITNVNTVGYKSAKAQFSTLVTDTRAAGAYTAGGVQQKTRSLISEQGLPMASASNTDLSIDGHGFFVVRDGTNIDSANVQFTRAGSFTQDAAGYLRNTAGLYLQGWALDAQGNFVNSGSVDELVPINIAQLTGTAEATTNVRMRANLFSGETTHTAAYTAGNMASGAVEPHFSQSVTVYDSQGKSHDVTVSFLKRGTNDWAVEIYASPASQVTEAGGLLQSGNLRFNGDGSLDRAGSTAALFNPVTATWTGGSNPSQITFNLGSDDEIDGITQFGSESSLISKNANGAIFGNVAGVSIDPEGTVTALFDNGLRRAVYKLPVATFQNPDGLLRLQGNAYGTSDFSGTYALNPAGSGGSGKIAPSTLEASTVDLAEEFTSMITVQRAYSASTKVITTADEMLAELNQIRR